MVGFAVDATDGSAVAVGERFAGSEASVEAPSKPHRSFFGMDLETEVPCQEDLSSCSSAAHGIRSDDLWSMFNEWNEEYQDARLKSRCAMSWCGQTNSLLERTCTAKTDGCSDQETTMDMSIDKAQHMFVAETGALR